MCSAHSLVQHVHKATRGENTLDLVISDYDGPVKSSVHAPIGHSDHGVVIVDFHKASPQREAPSSRNVWRYNAADWGRLRAHFRKLDWSEILNDDDPQASCRNVTDAIYNGMTQFIPVKKLVTKPTDPTWWTPECTAAVKAKEKAWSRWRNRTGDTALKQCFINSVNHASVTLQRAQQASEARLRARLSSGSLRDKQWWTNIKAAAGGTRQSDIPVLIDSDGNEYTDRKQKAECLAKHFASKCSLGDTDLTPQELPPATQPCRSLLSHIHFRPQVVRKHLAQLDTSKATGPDGVPCRVLKECCAELAMPLAKLYTICFQAGVQPDSWKLAHVVPIHKRASRSLASNYRPVSLLSVMSKVMEGIINKQIVNYLETHHVIPDSQYGFRRGRGTADILTALQNEWMQTIGQGGCAEVLAVDIAGAFDRVSHIGILYKAQQAGLSGKLLEWLKDYLTKRQIRVVLNGQSSDSWPISAGVPQGSLLGPTLFLLYVSDIDLCLVDNVQLCSFADDTTLYTVIKSPSDMPDATASLQKALSNLGEWGDSWRISFEPKKSQRMVITTRKDMPSLNPLSFGNTPVPETKSIKLLGVTFDQQLSFRQHIRNIATRACQRLGFLRKASRVLHPRDRSTVYKGFVRPMLEYAPLVWMGASHTQLSLDLIEFSEKLCM